jgi:hypothetical protein
VLIGLRVYLKLIVGGICIYGCIQNRQDGVVDTYMWNLNILDKRNRIKTKGIN